MYILTFPDSVRMLYFFFSARAGEFSFNTESLDELLHSEQTHWLTLMLKQQCKQREEKMTPDTEEFNRDSTESSLLHILVLSLTLRVPLILLLHSFPHGKT